MVQRVIYICLAAIAIAIVLRVFGKRQQTRVSGDPNIFMPAMAERAVALAAARGVKLDYSPDSIKAVDSILGDLHNSRARGAMVDQEVIKAHLPIRLSTLPDYSDSIGADGRSSPVPPQK